MLYFAYTARIEPDAMAQVCPSARFAFIAHLPDRRLHYPLEGNGWSGGLPTATEDTGSTVWGAVYEVPGREAGGLDAIEGGEGRVPVTTHAIDRMGRRHAVTTHVAGDAGTRDLAPSPAYVGIMLRGSRHWSLPAGWIAGLEDVLATSM